MMLSRYLLRPILFLSIFGLSSSLFENVLNAQDTYQEQLREYDRDDIHSIHKKLYIKEGRHEAGVNFGGIMNNTGYGLFTASYQYHFFENAGVEAGMGGIGFQFGDNNRLLFYQASLTFSPLYGKVSLFTWAVMNFDIYILGGAGVVSYSGLSDGSSFMSNVGIGQRFFINEWLSFKAEFRDYIYSRKNPGTSTSRESVIHNYAITGGLAVLIPFRQRY